MMDMPNDNVATFEKEQQDDVKIVTEASVWPYSLEIDPVENTEEQTSENLAQQEEAFLKGWERARPIYAMYYGKDLTLDDFKNDWRKINKFVEDK